MPRNIVFAIDVEPDPVRYGPDDSWEGTARTLGELSALRNHIQQKTGAAFRLNWFARFDPHMERAWGPDWVPQAWLLNTAAGNGDFIGVQVHMWKWQDSRGGWFSDFANPFWRAECLESGIAGYRALLGMHPSASRFSDRQLVKEDLPPLRKSGIHYDMTLEPGASAYQKPAESLGSGHLLDPHPKPRKPYRPTAEGTMMPKEAMFHPNTGQDLWLVPLTLTRRAHWMRVKRPPFFTRTKMPLNVVLHPRGVWSQLSSEINKEVADPVVFVVRSGDLADPFLLSNFRMITEKLADHSRPEKFRFVGVDQAVEDYARSLEKDGPFGTSRHV